jgi:hypothetical protein
MRKNQDMFAHSSERYTGLRNSVHKCAANQWLPAHHHASHLLAQLAARQQRLGSGGGAGAHAGPHRAVPGVAGRCVSPEVLG